MRKGWKSASYCRPVPYDDGHDMVFVHIKAATSFEGLDDSAVFPDDELGLCRSFTLLRRNLIVSTGWAGLLSLRAKRLAPVVSDEETRLLISINEGVPVELTDRVGSLIQKRDDCSLTVEENRELLQFADELERPGVERLEALSYLAELHGVSLRVLMQSLRVAAGNHG
jgi:hypothetical protein